MLFIKFIKLFVFVFLLFVLIPLVISAVNMIVTPLGKIVPEAGEYIGEYMEWIVLAAIVVYIFFILKISTDFDILYILKKYKKAAAIIFAVIAAALFAGNAVDFFVEERDWVITTGTVEGITGPENWSYWGSYIDESGNVREDAEIYFFPFSSPYGLFNFAFEPLVHKEILIHYDPGKVYVDRGGYGDDLCDSKLYYSEIADLILSAVLFIVSVVFLIRSFKPKAPVTEASDGHAGIL